MGNKDRDERIYLRNPSVFADACNYALFGGANVIKPESLREMDTSHVASIIEKEIDEVESQQAIGSISADDADNYVKRIKNNLGKLKPERYVDRLRDVFREAAIMSDGSTTYVLIGVEAQTHASRDMIIRVMEMDAASYRTQAQRIGDLNRAAGRTNSDSYISKLLPGDCLLPVITLVILFSDESWNAPRSLSELFKEYDPRLAPYIQDYRMNLIVPSEITDFDRFHTDLGLIMKFTKIMHDSEAVKALLDENDGAAYRNLGYDAARLLGKITNINTKEIETARTERGGVNMLTAWEQHGIEEAAKAVAENDKKWQAITADLESKISNLEAQYAEALAKINELQKASV